MAISGDAVDQGYRVLPRVAALKALAEALGDAYGSAILRMDEADDVILLEYLEGVVEGGLRSLGGVAPPPELPRQSPSELEARPALRCGETDQASEGSTLLLLQRPHARLAELPVADQEEGRRPAEGQLAPLSTAADRRRAAAVPRSGAGAPWCKTDAS
jgi:hypothetical protein